MAWLIIIISGFFEVAWAIALKQSQGFTRLGPTLVFIPLYFISAIGLGIGLRTVPVGPGYTVWVAMGALGAIVAGILLFGESFSVSRLIPLALIGVGVIWLAAGDTG